MKSPKVDKKNMKWRWLFERRWKNDGSWGSFIVGVIVAVILFRNLFDDHVVMQRYWYANLIALCVAIMSAVRDLVIMVRPRNE
ncbi:hypothetical protein [Roseovarius sp. A-2]|uniref:hypothetical protein n=1 Tax=Roseovarius sp. A-2 TaxID=1570360 RepID=UPI00111A6C31|nr:hypothetical protein [Roseovarius sp. A-2]